MYNRFSQRERLRSDFIPQEFIPNFELLAQALSTQQNRYDQAIEASSKLPQYIRESQLARQAVAEIKANQEARMEEVNEAYRTGGIQAGNIARKQFINELKQDYSPGGRANRLENDYALYQEYRKQLQENKDITKDVRDAALARSLGDYEATFDAGNPFSGYQTQNYVDVQAKLDKLADGFEKEVREGTAIINGRRVGKTMNGQYFYMDTEKREYIPPGEVRNFVMQMALSDPEIQAFYRQEDDLFGGTFDYQTVDEQGNPVSIPMSRSMYSLNTIADALGDKYESMQQTVKTNLVKNWVFAQDRQHALDKKLQETDRNLHRASLLLKTGEGKPKLDASMWDKTRAEQKILKEIESLERIKSASQGNLMPTEANRLKQLRKERQALLDMPDNKQKAARDFIDWVQGPEGKRQYPGFYEKFASQLENSDPSVPVDERLQNAVDQYNEVIDDINTRVMTGTVIEGDDRKRANYNLFGDGTYGGDLNTYVIRPYNKGTFETGPATDLLTYLKEKGLDEEDWRDLKKNFTVSKEFNPDSAGIPGGMLVTGVLPDEDGEMMEVNFILPQTSIENQNYYQQFEGFYKGDLSPFEDHGYGTGYGEPIKIQSPTGEAQTIQMFSEPKFLDGKYQGMDKKIFYYNPETGERTPSNLTPDQISQYIEESNPFRNY